ncbi:MAG: MATE family efflux transporter [Thiovulaceae bacterium]|nr:MATE family efflux transporter [Sulfurimonadaceae bacterium]
MIRTILLLAIPAALKHLLDMIQILIDLVMVSSLGVDEVAAVGLGLQFMMVLGVVMTVFSVGGNATIARLKGSGRIQKANIALYNLTLLAIGLAVISTVVIVPFVPLLYTFMQASSEVTQLGDLYFGTLSLGLVLIFLDMLFFTYFSAMGNTTISLYIKIGSAVLNVTLNYMLIFGNWGAPALGVEGAAIATLIATGFNVLIYLSWILYSNYYGIVRSYSKKMMKEMWRIGYPAALERGIGSLSFMLFVAIIAGFSTEALAGYQIGLRIEGLAFMPGFGFAIASMTLVGQYLGAKDPTSAEKAALVTSYIAAGFMGFVGIFMVMMPEVAIHFFTKDPVTVREASIYLQLVGISQVPLAMMFVLSSALRGAGAVKMTLYISLISLWTLRIIPSYIASLLSNDILWVYIAMTVETFVKGWLFYYLFKKGSWKKIKLKV